jgi:hypothetical protein
MTLPGPEGFTLYKSKSLGALRRRGGHGLEEQEAIGIPLKRSSSSKKLVIEKSTVEGGNPLEYEESDDPEKSDKKSSRKLRSMSRKERHAGTEMMRLYRKGVPLELQQLGPRAKSASSLHDFVCHSESAASKDLDDHPERKPSTASTRSEEADGSSTATTVDMSAPTKRLDSLELSEAPVTGSCSPPAKAKPALDEYVQTEEVEHSKRKASQKNKKSKKNRDVIPPSPGGIRALPGDLMPLAEHDKAEEAAQLSLAEADGASFPDPPAPQASSSSSPKPPSSSAAQSFASLRHVEVPKQAPRTHRNVPSEVSSRPASAPTGCSRAADPNLWNVGFDDNAKGFDDALSVWDDCKDVYCAWGGGDDDWGQDMGDWQAVGAAYAWE